MNFKTIIKNGTLVTGEGREKADIGIEHGKITAVGQNLHDEKAKVIDASDKLVLPGGIDVHVHLQLPFCGTVSADGFENGTKAAACGGVTTLIDFAIQKKGETLMEAIEQRRAEADSVVCIDYGLHAVSTAWSEAVKREMRDIVDYGIPSFKLFMVYRKEGWIAEDDVLFAALEQSAELNALVGVHAESATILDILIDRYHTPELMKEYGAYLHAMTRPNYIEAEAISRAVYWTEATKGNLYMVHMSGGPSADIVKAAKERGVHVFAETCPHYLLLNDELFKGEDGHLYGTCPQIKKPKDSRRLWRGLRDGELSIVSTDTCTFDRKQKSMWEGDFTKIPFGMPGVETMLPLLYSYGVAQGKISLERMVELISTNPAKLMGMYPNKGSLKIGTDADITILDPNSSQTLSYKNLQTNCDWSPFEGFETVGMPVYTLSKGEIVAEKGRFVGKVGAGEFLRRSNPVFEL